MKGRLLLLMTISWLALGPAVADEILPEPRQVSDRVWNWVGPYGGPDPENQGFRMNLAFVVGDDAVAVIDTGYTPEMAREMIAAIRERTQLPIRYAVNTDARPARFMGNGVFQEEGAEVFAHEDAARFMMEHSGRWVRSVAMSLDREETEVPPPAPPNELLIGDRTLDLGGVTLKLVDVGRAHTPGHLVVRVPEEDVVYAGDVLYSGRLLSVRPESDTRAWSDAYEALREMPEAIYIPGHGEPAPLADFEHPTYDYLVALADHMDHAFDQGMLIGEAIETFDDSAWSDLENYEDLASSNANRAYLEAEMRGF